MVAGICKYGIGLYYWLYNGKCPESAGLFTGLYLFVIFIGGNYVCLCCLLPYINLLLLNVPIMYGLDLTIICHLLYVLMTTRNLDEVEERSFFI